MNCSLGNYYEICLSNYHWFPLPHGCPHILRSLKSSVNASLCCGWLRAKPEPSIGAHFTRGRSARASTEQGCARRRARDKKLRTPVGAEGRRMWPIKIWWSLSDQSRSSNQEATWPLGREETTHDNKMKRCMTLFLRTLPLSNII